MINVYINNPTDGGTDGDLVTDTNPITLSSLRGAVSKIVKCSLRADLATCYLCKVGLTGKNADKVQLSLDCTNWVSNFFVFQVGLSNAPFYMQTIIGDSEPFGLDDSVSLQLDYYRPV
jgi:hypothetical protein